MSQELKNKQLVKPYLTAILLSMVITAADSKTINHANIEKAARMNVAENICDINFGTGPGSLVHFVMLAAAELRVEMTTGAQRYISG